jgi:hypothetical protein
MWPLFSTTCESTPKFPNTVHIQHNFLASLNEQGELLLLLLTDLMEVRDIYQIRRVLTGLKVTGADT